MDDRSELLYSGPHMLNKPIIVKVWSADFDLNKEVLQTISIWVKYPNLPLNCWSIDSLSRISSGLRIPLYADECTTKVNRISFARVLVEMDVARDLPMKLKVEDPNGRVFEQIVQYEWVPEYCTKCMQVGHKCQDIGLRPKAAAKMVNKWLQKQVASIESGIPKTTIEVKESSKAIQTDDAGLWQQVTPKAVARGSPIIQNKEVCTTNGFETLVALGKDTTSTSGEKRGREEASGGNFADLIP